MIITDPRRAQRALMKQHRDREKRRGMTKKAQRQLKKLLAKRKEVQP